MLMHNPFHFLILYVKALVYNCFYYIRGCIGILGLLDVRFAIPVYVVTAIVFLSSFLFLSEKKVSNEQRFLSIVVLFMFLTMLHCVLYVTWTPQNSYKVIGFQGRYLISVLPFIFMIFAQGRDYVSEKLRRYFKIFLIVFIFLLLVYASLVLVKTYHTRWINPILYYFL